MRIASLAKSNTEILCALGCAGQIIAATSFDKKTAPKAQIIGSYTDIDIQKVAGLKPDIAFTSTFLQEKYSEQLEESGIEVVHLDPHSVDDIMKDIACAGKACGRGKKALNIVSGMKNEIGAIKKSVRGKTKTKVYVEEWPRPPMAAGNWVVQMIEMAGGTGILFQGERSREVSLHEVKEFEPQQVILNWCGIGKKADVDLVKKREGWDSIAAIREGRITAIDDSYFNTPSQNVVEGIKILRKVLHG